MNPDNYEEIEKTVKTDPAIQQAVATIVERLGAIFGDVRDYTDQRIIDTAARHVARKILRTIDVYDAYGCPLCLS